MIAIVEVSPRIERDGTAATLDAAVRELRRAQKSSARLARNRELSPALWSKAVALQAALDGLEATLRRWASLTNRATDGRAAIPRPSNPGHDHRGAGR